jgi:LacI family transcriptional regulator
MSIDKDVDIGLRYPTLSAIEYYTTHRDVLQLLKRPSKDIGIFATGALQTLGALHAIRRTGFNIPDDIGFVGMDYQLADIHIDSDIPVITQPIKKLVNKSVNLLLQKISNNSLHKNIHRKISADFSMIRK